MVRMGIASILIPKGMTNHRLFRLPSELNDIEIGQLTLKIYKRKLRESDVIIREASSMIPKKKALEVGDKTLKDMSYNN